MAAVLQWPLYYRRGRAHAKRSQWKEAIADYTRAIDLGAKDPEVWSYRSEAHGQRKQWAMAEKDVSRAIELGRDDLFVLFQRGTAYQRLGQYEKAIDDFTRYINRGSAYASLDAQVAGIRGSAYASLGQWDKAEADLEKSFGSPTFPVLTHMYSLVWLGKKDAAGYRKACARLLAWAGPKPIPDVALWAAWTCVLIPEGGDPAQLVKLAERAASTAPKNRDSLLVRGAALYRAGRWKDAIESLNQALKAPQGVKVPGQIWDSLLIRSSPVAFDNTGYELLFLAMAHHRLGESDEARRWLDKGVRWMEQAPLPKTAQGRDNPIYSWHRRLAHETLLREAESLLKETQR
jgi:tetratricopeptide (TPR) repeat protein